jgi:hypothetical protein
MPPNPDVHTVSVFLIDGNETDRAKKMEKTTGKDRTPLDTTQSRTNQQSTDRPRFHFTRNAAASSLVITSPPWLLALSIPSG